MDGVFSEANENDNTERPVRRRHSSILKPPRSPLQDLRGGNETIQDSNALRNKKSSRRVSFADTIKIFQTESHMKTVRTSEITETEGENVLLMLNKNSEDNHSEITGMNTLLCAPIQTQMQQREFSIIEHSHGRKHENDQTVIFSDENQMDLTASHTVMITKGLLDCTKSEKSTKIDTKSFLANLKLHNEDSRMKKELNFCMHQNTSPEKKINFNDFIKRLKMDKSNASPSKGLGKENSEIMVHCKESNRASSVHQVHVSLNVEEDNSNVTRIFREQDDEMNFTQCHTANIQTLVPTSREAILREFKGGDTTICGNDFMDLTINHTSQILPSADNSSGIENQTHNVMMGVTRGYETKASGKKILKNKPTATFQDPALNSTDKIHINRSHIIGAEIHTVTQTSNQDAKTSMISESICSSPTVQGCETVFYSGCNDAMELTNCLSGMREEKNLLKHDSNSSKIYPNPDTISFLIDKSAYSGEDSMDITKSHTVAIDHQIFKQDQTNVKIATIPVAEKEIMLRNHLTVSEDGKMNVNCSSIIHVPKGRLQQSLANSFSISLTDKKTELFTDDDMDLTKSHISNLGGQAPLVSLSLAPENTSKSHSRSKSPSDEWEEITKNHTETSPRPHIISKNILGKPKVTSPDEESVFFPENGENDHPAAKSSQLTLQRECSNSGPIEKPVAFVAHGNMEVSQSTHWKNDKNGMDITQSCTVEISHKSALKDREDFHFVPLAETSKTVLYTCGQDDMEITRSHTVALECKTVPPNEITTKPMDKTVMFVDNHNDLEVTKSHTVFIDCQAMEKILDEYPKLGIPRGKSYGSSAKEFTKSQAMAIENKIFHTEQQHHIPFAPTNTLSGDQGEVEITKFHSTVMDEEVMEKVVDQPYTLEKAKMESFHLNSTGRRNEDLRNSHATVTCGSSDKYSCLPNVISDVDNLKGNIMSLCDKDKKKFSNCPVQNDFVYANDLAREYYSKPEGLLISAPVPLLEKTEITQANTKGQLDCVMTLPKDQEDPVKEPQNLLDNQTLECNQDLEEMTKLNLKTVSFELPEDRMEDLVNNAEHSLKKTFCDDFVASQPHLSTQLPPLLPKGQSIINKDETVLSKAANKNLNIVENLSVPKCENEFKMLNNEKQITVASNKELKESVQTSQGGTAKDIHSNLDLTKQASQTHANPREPSDLVIASNLLNFSSIKPNLNNLNGKTKDILGFQAVCIPSPSEHLLEASKAHNDSMQATEMHNNIVSNSVKDNRSEERNSHNGAAINSVPVMTVVKDRNKVRRCSLGIFLPRLPNKRNCSVTGIDEQEQISADTSDLNYLETQPVSSKDSGPGFVVAQLDLSPSQYINEENLPMYPGEINSSDSISIGTEGKALIETYQREILLSQNKVEETCNSQKRTWIQEDDDTQNEKKMKKNEIFGHQTEGDIDKNVNSVLMKSLCRSPSSCSSSLDSIKADGTSLDFSTHRSSQMESQFLRDTICEESLKEKLQDGKITIREFFILLQVHILIQKPRQSNLPAKFAVNTPPTLEDLMLSQYVYRPKIKIYKEDCEALHHKIEELKLSAMNQDKLLTDVNRNLWEKMRHCSDEELKAFGIYLNKIKSRFTKMTKVFTHQGKVALYSKLLQSAQSEREKLQIRMDEMDNILKKIDNYLTEMELETKNLEDEEKANPMEEWDSEMRAAEKELEQLKTEEEKLQRDLSELEVQKEQTLAQIDFVQKQTNRTEELLDQLSLSEWDVIEWSDDQAVFTFLYDTIELTITFGEPVVGLPFLDKAQRKIVDLNFQSLLDEDKAPPSSLLVHKLIFQYVEEQEYWKKRCTMQHQVPKMLQEISLVVSHCRFLGEEIEFLKRWGPNYNLMNIDVNNTELRLLFSSSAAFAKFEIILSLSAHYPSVPLPFTIQNHLGNIGQDEIADILSNVPLEDNYLKNIVKKIYRDLLQDCHFHQ
ncbi:outer kinetochore KNL1 complex subunit KNL1 isoform X2 [Dasypus novemcinctus]|uniref:outer kinetochore KNL1 complex subunit KNL1 isoform X2 n=1 Tax=Dasypus novemcinctus TaxID=9361 RepID=UPI00265EA6CF|nr:kinetochore scaffold 1 isoform X2 [Dasypus novemcinctus]